MKKLKPVITQKLNFLYANRARLEKLLDENDQRLFPKNCDKQLLELAEVKGRIKALTEIITQNLPY